MALPFVLQNKPPTSILGRMDGFAENHFPVVGIGASAGGLSALTQLIAALPPLPGLALVVIQHLDPKHESRLNELLQPHTSMTRGRGRAMASRSRPTTSTSFSRIPASRSPTACSPSRPVPMIGDLIIRWIISCGPWRPSKGQYSVGVILSGTGSDGTLGICEIKAAGGLTFAQDEHSAQHAGMPQSAIASGAVDLVLPPADIAGRLAAVRQHPYLSTEDESESGERREAPEEFQRVIAALRNSSGVDFSQYRDTTHQTADRAPHDAARLHVAARVRAVSRTRPG